MRKDANIIWYQSDRGQHLVYGSFQTPVYRTSFGNPLQPFTPSKSDRISPASTTPCAPQARITSPPLQRLQRALRRKLRCLLLPPSPGSGPSVLRKSIQTGAEIISCELIPV